MRFAAIKSAIKPNNHNWNPTKIKIVAKIKVGTLVFSYPLKKKNNQRIPEITPKLNGTLPNMRKKRRGL